MFKKMTRKGVSLASGLALLSGSLIAATPASAAGELVMEPSGGSLFAVPSGQTFTAKVYFAPGQASTEVQKLKVKATTNGGFQLNSDSGNTAAAAVDGLASLVASGTTSASKAAAGSATSPHYFGFEVNSASTATTYTVTLQAYIDADNDDVIDAGEWTSAATTLTFLKHSAITWNVDLKNPVIGNTTGEVRVTSDNINLNQFALAAPSQLAVVFSDDTNAQGTQALVQKTTNSYAIPLGYDTVNGWFDATSAAFSAATASGDTVKVSVFHRTAATAFGATSADGSAEDNWDELIWGIGGADGKVGDDAATAGADESADDVVPGAANFDLTAVGSKTEVVSAVAASAITEAQADASADNTAATTGNANDTSAVRTGATSVTVYAEATLAAGQTSANVVFEIAESAASSLVTAGASVTAGGKTLTNSNAGTVQSVEVIVASDADGYAELTLTLSGLKKDDAFAVTPYIQGTTKSATDDVIFTVTDSVATTVYNTNAVNTNLAGGDKGALTVAKETDFNLSYSVLDQYGAPLTTAGHSITVSDGTSSWSANVNNGAATVTVPGYLTAGSRTMTPTVYKNGVDVTISEPTATVRVGATIPAAASISVAATNETSGATNATGARADLNLKAQSSVDARLNSNSAVSRTASTMVNVTGTVLDIDGNGTQGSASGSVTVTGAGLMFVTDSVYAVGEITLQTASDGTFDVGVLSNTVGKHTITVSAGSATKTKDLYWIATPKTTSGLVTFDAPASALPGQAIQIKAMVKDKFGNAVDTDATAVNRNSQSGDNDATDLGETPTDFKMTYSGPGFPLTSSVTGTDEDGLAEMKILLGANDKGTGVVTVKYDTNDDGDYTDATDIVATWTITIGGSASEDTKVNAGSFKGYVAIYAKGYEGKRLSAKVGKDWVVVPVLASNFVRVVEYTGAGYTVAVRIYIDRVLIDTITVTTK